MSVGQGFTIWSYNRPFTVDGRNALVKFQMTTRGAFTTLFLDGLDLTSDFTPYTGLESVRNHRLIVTLPDGRTLDVEAGYYNWVNVAIAVRLNGRLVHESHPGVTIIMPEKIVRMVEKVELEKADQNRASVTRDPATPPPPTPDPNVDFDRLTANQLPIIVDIVTSIMFYIVAKSTNLTTAALVGAATGMVLLVVQRATKLDLLGGLAKFGIIMLLISAGLAFAFQDDDMVKMRSTLVGLIGATAFISDGIAGGRWLGEPMARYMVYTDIQPRRLAFGMGGVGLAMAGLNWIVARTVSTDAWLFYTTFIDIAVSISMILLVIRWARGLPVLPRR